VRLRRSRCVSHQAEGASRALTRLEDPPQRLPCRLCARRSACVAARSAKRWSAQARRCVSPPRRHAPGSSRFAQRLFGAQATRTQQGETARGRRRAAGRRHRLRRATARRRSRMRSSLRLTQLLRPPRCPAPRPPCAARTRAHRVAACSSPDVCLAERRCSVNSPSPAWCTRQPEAAAATSACTGCRRTRCPAAAAQWRAIAAKPAATEPLKGRTVAWSAAARRGRRRCPPRLCFQRALRGL